MRRCTTIPLFYTAATPRSFWSCPASNWDCRSLLGPRWQAVDALLRVLVVRAVWVRCSSDLSPCLPLARWFRRRLGWREQQVVILVETLYRFPCLVTASDVSFPVVRNSDLPRQTTHLVPMTRPGHGRPRFETMPSVSMTRLATMNLAFAMINGERSLKIRFLPRR